MLIPITNPIIFVAQEKPAPGYKTLSQQDTRLMKVVPAAERGAAGFRDMARWVRQNAMISLGTTEEEMNRNKDFFLFGNVRAGDLMEAYATLYRMRWVRYRQGKPHYDLTFASDSLNRLYAPQGSYQQERFAFMNSFMAAFDAWPDDKKKEVLAGKELKIAELPGPMKTAILGAVGALIRDPQLNNLNDSGGDPNSQTDTADFANGALTIEDETEKGKDIRELSVSISNGNNTSGFTFRWNNYDPKKGTIGMGRPVILTIEPEPTRRFSRDRMIRTANVLNRSVTIGEGEWDLHGLLRFLALKHRVNFITNQDTHNILRRFHCRNVPLWLVLDRISLEFGGWEWELAPGNFIVMRSKESPRRRDIRNDE
ncbi:MAG: hypothetical protein SFU56_14990 [Capsulimonadales bacterium]|nr:hypothetical protein [Capsulimonadales bacterium]